MTSKPATVANSSKQSASTRKDLFDLLRARGFSFLPARDPDAFELGHMRYPTFIRAGVRVAIQSGRCLGEDRGTAMIYDSDRTDVVVWGLRTEATSRRKGLARAAMMEILACADETGVTLFLEPVPLEKSAANRAALQAFYASLGFSPTGPKCVVMERAPAKTAKARRTR
jgi:GNAT superfamily N-acetyltransferase